MQDQPRRVGFIGVTAERSWSSVAHIPALRLMAEEFTVAGVANSSRASAESAAHACGIPLVFADPAQMIESADIDVIAVTVKVPHHYGLVKYALEAGKHVYCEWPLGNGLEEAQNLTELSLRNDAHVMIGTQAIASPVISRVADLIAQGAIGDVLSSSILGTGQAWGPTIASHNAYLYDRSNGATMLTIPVGHVLAAVHRVLGEITAVSCMLRTQRGAVRIEETGKLLNVTSPDQVMVCADLASGANLSLHYHGGTPCGTGFLWEIHGTRGDIRISGPGGHAQLVPLQLQIASIDEPELRLVEVPRSYSMGLPEDTTIGNVARLYRLLSDDLKTGTRTAPAFNEALRLHRVIDAMERSSESGLRVSLT